ncbi:hypothetical protein L484_027005 [Morus notabilis]|uniref:Uncharacterized protein n=1 Tax=Morus notabilis TaxID=981085 RepID=W9R9F1_9ROSA|nr:hypothetical protein L484_027005 [Morus notabilis]
MLNIPLRLLTKIHGVNRTTQQQQHKESASLTATSLKMYGKMRHNLYVLRDRPRYLLLNVDRDRRSPILLLPPATVTAQCMPPLCNHHLSSSSTISPATSTSACSTAGAPARRR